MLNDQLKTSLRKCPLSMLYLAPVGVPLSQRSAAAVPQWAAAQGMGMTGALHSLCIHTHTHKLSHTHTYT